MNRRTFLAASPALGFFLHGAATFAQSGPGSAKAEAVRAQIEKDYPQMLSVAPEEGKFLGMLARLSRAKEALEIGTSRGYTTLWLAAALQQTGGRLTTLDILKERTEEAQENLEKAGLAAHINFQTGDAHQIVPGLKKKFDFVLLDADKKGNLDYFQKLHPALLAPTAILIAHGAKTMANDLKPFMDAVFSRKDFDSITASIVPEESFFIALRK